MRSVISTEAQRSGEISDKLYILNPITHVMGFLFVKKKRALAKPSFIN